MSLVLIADQKRHLGCASAVKLAQSPDGEDFMLAIWRGVIGDQRHLAIIVDKTDSPQPVVCDSLAEFGPLKIAEKDAALRERSVELHHQWLVLRADGPDDHGGTIFHGPRRSVLHRVGPHRRLGKRAGEDTF